jgi:hypothetical protein
MSILHHDYAMIVVVLRSPTLARSAGHVFPIGAGDRDGRAAPAAIGCALPCKMS